MKETNDSIETPVAWIGWDWADKKHDIFLQSADGVGEQFCLPNQPEALHNWLKELGRRFDPGKVVLCIEASRSALLPIFLSYPFLEFYLVNPKSMARFREVFCPSGGKNDRLDSRLACLLVRSHRDLLHEFAAEDEVTQELALLVEYRRRLVDQRTMIANQLKDALKLYNPLALELLKQDTTTTLAANFVLKFPTLNSLQQTRLDRVRKFFVGQGCRLTVGLERRLAMIGKAVAVTEQPHWNNPHSFMACALAEQLKALCARVATIEEQICILADQHPNKALAQSLPGAAEALEPRLMALLGTRTDVCASAEYLAVRDGVAPRRVQSGNTSLITHRLAKPQFDHQTWIEFAKSSTLTCVWAREFVQAKRKSGKSYYTAIRALAYKWIRILYACWRDGVVYDEQKYLAALKKKNSPYAAAD